MNNLNILFNYVLFNYIFGFSQREISESAVLIKGL